MDTATVSERPILITLEQAAQRLAISRRTLERLIAAGEFPSPLKLGRASRLAVEDIERCAGDVAGEDVLPEGDVIDDHPA